MSDASPAGAPLSLVGRAPIDAVDLALSGGGFRATLFHLGVIAYLRDHGNQLLKRVEIICSVSGGSILAAHLACHWDDYSSDVDAVFHARVSQLVASITERNVSTNVLERSTHRLVDFKPLDSERLEREYVELLDLQKSPIRRWDDLPQRPPHLYILATHLNTGRAGAFCREGFDILPLRADARHRHEKAIRALTDFARAVNITNQDITRAVAASSAFPPAFAPISLALDDDTHMLTDGGVFDNSGVNYLRYLYEAAIANPSRGPVTNPSRRLVIVSDAGREFPTELRGQYDTFLALALRVTDAQGSRIAESDSAAATEFFEKHHIRVLPLSIHDRVPAIPKGSDNHTERVQALLRTIRTELDRFSLEEAFVLYRHGYRVAERAFAAGTSAPPTDAPWTPADSDRNLRGLPKDTLEKALENSHLLKKQLKGTLLRLAIKKVRKDYMWQAATAIVLGLALVAVIAYGSYMLGTPSPEEKVPPRGTLAIEEAGPYTGEGWASRVPSLTPLLGPGHVYTMASAPIGVLTNNRAHDIAAVSFEATSSAAGARLYLFLRQESDGEPRLTALEQATAARRFKLPPGGPRDRLLGIVVSETPLQNVQSLVKFTVEAP